MIARRVLLVTSVLGLVPLLGCNRAPTEQADLVLYNGHVLTVDKDFSIKSAVAVKDGKIVAVGGDEIAKNYDAPTKVDLQGKTLLPGFTDTHMHLGSDSKRKISMVGVKSIADIQDRIREKAKELGPGEWITGSGWSEYELTDQRIPLRADLDAAAPDNPVVLTRNGGHSSVGNSMALRLAKITRTTRDPEGGVIEKDANGEPNGVIRERSDLYYALVPKDSWDDLRPGYIRYMHNLLKLGITTYWNAITHIDRDPNVKDEQSGLRPMSSGGHPTWNELSGIYETDGENLPRGVAYMTYPGKAQLEAYPYHTGHGDDRLRMGPIGETPVDGGFTGPTAYTLVDYKGMPGFRGKPFYTEAQLQDMVDTSARLGWQLGLHAIGDAAIVMTVDAYDKALKSIPGKEHTGDDRRWFLAHYTIMPPERTRKLMAEDHIGISQQPNFSYTLVQRYVETMDADRVAHNNAIATPLKDGIFVAFASDNMPVDPRYGLYAAITRKGENGVAYGPEEAVSRQEAIRLYTAAGPYLSWDEKKKGTLEVGKFADMVVLDKDPLTIPEDELLTMNVLNTYVNGKMVYDRASDTDPLPPGSLR